MAMTPSWLNHYRIIGPLGAGGMGEVLVAEDTRLRRKVAIKRLPPQIAADDERRQRFEREARAIAALNHPNIVTVHSVEEGEGGPFLTMEYVEGRTVEQLITPSGLPVDNVLRVAIPVSDALSAAHQRGITHRDLKPANVMVTTDGRVKLLDFGLAKLNEPVLSGGTTPTTAALTRDGRILGTVLYMSPEQAEGKPVDARSDIFSFGVLLYEMATGQRPFRGDTTVAILSAILRDDPPPVLEIKPDLPPGLARVIKRCLAKEPSRRYQTAIDLRNDLEELLPAPSRHPVDTTESRVRANIRARRLFVGLVLALAIGLPVGVGLWRNRATANEAFEIARLARLTSEGNAALAAISQDGQYVVHVKDARGRPSLWIRQTATSSDVQIVPPGDAPYEGITYSRDGSHVYYLTYGEKDFGTLFRVPVLGGSPLRVIHDVDSPVAFSPDGAEMAFVRMDPVAGVTYLMLANPDGANVRSLATIGGDEFYGSKTISWSPRGDVILLPLITSNEARSNVYAVDVKSGARKALTDPWSSIRGAAWMPDGRSFLLTANHQPESPTQLWQVFYPSQQRRQLTNDLSSYSSVTISGNGKTVATVQSQTTTGIWTFDRSTGQQRQLVAGRRNDGLYGLTWSPAGRIVFASSRSGISQIWSMKEDGTDLQQVTNDAAFAGYPAVSSDGRWIVYVSERGDGNQLWRVPIDQPERPAVVAMSGSFRNPSVIDRDGWVYYMGIDFKPYRVRLEGGSPSGPLVADAFFPSDMTPMGELVGRTYDTKTRSEFAAVMPASGGSLKLLRDFPLDSSIYGLLISPDGRALTFVKKKEGVAEVWLKELTGGAAQQVTNSGGEHVFSYAWSPDGKRLTVARGRAESDVVLIQRK